jgi:PAS domain S-box-containing protein
MHFIGMLAFQFCAEVAFDKGLTLLSLLPALLASWVTLELLSRGRMTRWQWVLGGILVGAGIGSMHYTGMAAMKMSAQLRYDPLWFAASIAVAVLLAMLALWIRFGLEGRLQRRWAVLLGGLVMGCAISGMHYTAMAAARFVGARDQPCGHLLTDNGMLALAVTVATLTVSALTAGTNGLLGYRRLNRRLGDEQLRMQAMLDTAVDGVITIDGRGRIQSFNRAAEHMFGWPAPEIVGRNFRLLMPHPDQQGDEDYLAQHLATGAADIIGASRDVIGQHRDGQLLEVRLAVGRADLLGEPLFVAFVNDIRERRRMERALRASEQQYRSLIANSPGVVFRCRKDAQRSMLLISDSVQALTGWTAQDFLDGTVSFAQLLHPDDRERVDAEAGRALGANEPYVLEYRLRTRVGGERWLSETGRCASDETGNLQWIDGVILDISESKRMQLALEEAKRRAEAGAAAKSAFLANMSHEIRTPMNAILGFTELLLDTDLNAAQRKHLGTVHGSARSLLGLLNDILDTAKLDKGAVDLEERDFSLRAVCEQTLASLRLGAQRKGLGLVLDYPQGLPEFFRGDALRLQQVLVNIVGNAIKFTERGLVTLRMRLEQSQVHLSVRDTGIGIAEDRLEGIFDAFAQADASTTRRFGGTGLGTTISRQLVERMGGRITVNSVPGEGSCFHVWLPLPLGRVAVPDAAATGEPATQDLPPLRLLVADDIAQNGELMQLLLGHDGHQVRLVTDGLQALHAFSEDEFDAVLMDVHMPVLDGLGATRRIRNFELAHGRLRTPVVALTASVLEEDRQAALAAGMDGFATKPVEPARLRAELARVLGLSPAQAPAVAGPANPMASGIPVLQHEQGLRLWGSAAAWQRGLRRFADEQQGSAQRLESLLSVHEWSQARELVHRLRGVAGSLAMPQLLEAAQPLEEALRQGRHGAMQAQVQALTDALAQVLKAITAQGAGVPPLPAVALPQREAGDVAAPMLRLERSLRRGQLDDAALQALLGVLGAPACGALVEALDIFDFEAALRSLQTLREQAPMP